MLEGVRVSRTNGTQGWRFGALNFRSHFYFWYYSTLISGLIVLK